jgi:hypothetical protein
MSAFQAAVDSGAECSQLAIKLHSQLPEPFAGRIMEAATRHEDAKVLPNRTFQNLNFRPISRR